MRLVLRLNDEFDYDEIFTCRYCVIISYFKEFAPCVSSFECVKRV